MFQGCAVLHVQKDTLGTESAPHRTGRVERGESVNRGHLQQCLPKGSTHNIEH